MTSKRFAVEYLGHGALLNEPVGLLSTAKTGDYFMKVRKLTIKSKFCVSFHKTSTSNLTLYFDVYDCQLEPTRLI